MTTPYRDPDRGPYVQDRRSNTMAWTLGALAAALVLGFVLFGMGGTDKRTADNPAPTTTGQGERSPAQPLPANPSGTTPQPDPAQPTPR